jgi:O-antigen ligase
MGLFFSFLFIIAAYLSPDTVFGDLALYHIEVLIAAIALIFAFLGAQGSGILQMTQTWALAVLCFVVAFSIVLTGWIGGGLQAIITFVPEVSAFFLIYLTCKTKKHLQILVVLLFFAAAFIIYHGAHALRVNDLDNEYLLTEGVAVNEQGVGIYRIRGLSFLNDPNDTSQFFVALIPCLFFFWKKGAKFRNLLQVYLPAAFLLWGMFLTHSRGGMVALMAIAIVAGRRKIGTIPAIVGGAVLFVVLLASGFSGGRDVSADAGEDRMEAWSEGLQMIKSHPLFGVGFAQFSEHYYITAHNTIVVCAAELGLVGAFFWVLFVFVTIRNVAVSATDPVLEAEAARKKREKNSLRPPTDAEVAEFSGGAIPQLALPGAASGATSVAASIPAFRTRNAAFELRATAPGMYRAQGRGAFGLDEEEEDPKAGDAEVRRMAGLMVLSFAGFLAAGWFLSRAYTMCLFVNAGIAAVVYKMALDRGIAPPPLPAGRAMKLSAYTLVALLALVYIILRTDHFLPK